jgi:hypothetical protein
MGKKSQCFHKRCFLTDWLTVWRRAEIILAR